MLKEKRNPRDWEIGDTFYYQINNPDVNIDKRYFIFIKVGNLDKEPIFRVKITEGNTLLRTNKELERLEYIKTMVITWEDRFIPFDGHISDEELIMERNKIKFYPDEFGFLHEYLINISIRTRRNVPKDWDYLGNFALTPPQDEYIPFSPYNIRGCLWITAKEELVRDYYRYNKRDINFYNKKIASERRKYDEGFMRMAISLHVKNPLIVEKLMKIVTTIDRDDK